MFSRVRNFLSLLKAAFKCFVKDDVFARAAAISYYAVFSLPGLLLIILTVSSIFIDEEMVIRKISDEITDILGRSGAETLQEIIRNLGNSGQSWITGAVGIVSLIFGVTSLFIQLQNALNSIWDVDQKSKVSFGKILKDRAISLGLVVALNFLLLISLIISAIITSLNSWLTHNIGEELTILTYLINILSSVAITTVVFAAIFKFLPDVKITWTMVWLGALVTAVLFNLGKEAFALYISYADPGSSFGAGSSIILFLLWIFYSALLVFYGAEFTQVYAGKYGKGIQSSSAKS